jgi:(2Fe-2S) ferredoxin
VKLKFNEFEIDILPFVQLCGMNCKKKEFIINSIEKHFSSVKYKDYEKEYQECFLVDGQILGRNYFKTYSIQNREDIIRYIQISKSSMMMQYFSNCLTEYNCTQDMSVIVERLENIFQNINETFLENGSKVKLSFEENNIFNLIQNAKVESYDGQDIHMLNNLELLTEFLQLIEKNLLYQPGKILLIFKNIDHLLERQEYQLFVDKVEKISNGFDISIICTLSIEGYVDIRKQFFEGIHIINDVVYQMPELERVKEFVQDHYPSGRIVSEKDVQNFCKEIMHKIGCDRYKLITRENVYLKLLNDSLVLRQKESENLDKMELDFIMD